MILDTIALIFNEESFRNHCEIYTLVATSADIEKAPLRVEGEILYVDLALGLGQSDLVREGVIDMLCTQRSVETTPVAEVDRIIEIMRAVTNANVGGHDIHLEFVVDLESATSCESSNGGASVVSVEQASEACELGELDWRTIEGRQMLVFSVDMHATQSFVHQTLIVWILGEKLFWNGGDSEGTFARTVINMVVVEVIVEVRKQGLLNIIRLHVV